MVLVLLFLVTACKTDYQHLPTFSEQKQLQVVILTPAGSNHPQTYDAAKKTFASAQEAGLPARIKFLPAPGNLGFIPSTGFKSPETAESHPLQALVLAESLATGTVVEVIPIGTLTLHIADETKYVIVTIPAKPSEQVVEATTLAELNTRYPVAKGIIQKWFLHHNPTQKVRLGGWHDEKYSEDLIRRYLE